MNPTVQQMTLRLRPRVEARGPDVMTCTLCALD